ncbi:MAG: hypothetical protein ABEJ92_03475 [Halobacteriales archaeon]
MEETTRSAWSAGLGAVGGYALILVVMTVLLFGLPYLAFVAL